MKVSELMDKLKQVDPNMEVMCTSNSGEYNYGIVHTAETRPLAIQDEDGFMNNKNEEFVFVIDEE